MRDEVDVGDQAKGATMSKIEPMSVERIKSEIATHLVDFPYSWGNNKIPALILAWIHAEAKARQAYHGWQAALSVDHAPVDQRAPGVCDVLNCPVCAMRFEDWVKVVKAELGWPSQSE